MLCFVVPRHLLQCTHSGSGAGIDMFVIKDSDLNVIVRRVERIEGLYAKSDPRNSLYA